MSDDVQITTWILEVNLSLFLERLSTLIGYRFDGSDRDAVVFGVGELEERCGQVYAYPLLGQSSVILTFAQAQNTHRLCVTAQTQAGIADRVEALARVLQCYDPVRGTQEVEVLVAVAFANQSRPDQTEVVACNAAHLARCLECQETLAFFKGRHWTALLREKTVLPRGYAGLGFLSSQARHFFFPAYLATAIRDKDADLLATALETVQDEAFTPLQQELIELAVYVSKL